MIILCSGSETRAKLLREAGVDFIQKSCEFDEESIKCEDPYRFVIEASYGKFLKCAECYDENDIITADTVVSDGKNILRKAKDINEAKRILLAQSGKNIKIITAMWVRYKNRIYARVDETVYKFAAFEKGDLEAYLSSGEWKGKAGACMVEGFCKKYIIDVQGYESTAMGLCIEELKRIINAD